MNYKILLSFLILCFSCTSDSYFGKACPFCNKEILERQTFYEEKGVLALYTHKPVFPNHCLIIPARHVERFEDLTPLEMEQIYSVIQKVHSAASKVFGTSSYLLLQKNGREVGQTVPHIHFHYIGRKKRDDSIVKLLWKMLLSDIQKPIHHSRMKETVQKIKKEINGK